MKNKLALLLSLFIIYSFTDATSQNAPSAIDNFVAKEGLKHASIGICIKDLSGNAIASYNKERSLTPASTLKLVTTASALELLGQDFQYKTELRLDSANESYRLIIKGYGDPTLGSEYLNQGNTFVQVWTDQIKKKVSKTIPLAIYVDDSYFGYNGLSQKWIREDIGNYFASGSYGISVFDNTYKLSLSTLKPEIAPVFVSIDPYIPNLSFENNLTTNTSGQDNGYIVGEPFTYNRILIGDIPEKRQTFTIKGSLPDPGLSLGQTLAQALTEQGYTIYSVQTPRADITQLKNLAAESSIFYTHHSPTLSNIIKLINERSNNHYTEHLIRSVGRKSSSEADPLAMGIDAIKTFWEARGLDMDALFMYDGCGLAPSNAISAELLCDMLVYMQSKSLYKDSFLNSLPKAGSEGTIRNFLKGSALTGKVFVKSGSIANVQCYAGYYINGNKKYAFSVMVNNFNGPRKQVVKAIEDLLLDVF